ncbi:AAA family ATPase [Maridesulfovibrio sp.]|uniref:AAA family ATPase n=1 Tax=Maridesulfovibrio sp. TaxID=2795000 RepID=UPI002A18704C|nr:AAA family ATPase [Maridesulfovibrio sp.]
MKLLIENFYNIKHAELDFKKFNILIGPQAAGKSLIAKMLYFMEEIINTYEMQSLSLEEIKPHNELNNNFFQLFYSIFEKRSLNNKFNITLSAENRSTWEFNSKGLIPSKYLFSNDPKAERTVRNSKKINTDLKNMYQSYIEIKERLDKIEDTSNEFYSTSLNFKNSFENFLNALNTSLDSAHLFIPASRSLVNIISDNSFWMRESNIDALLVRFGQTYSRQLKRDTADKPLTCKNLNSITNGQIERQDSGYVINENGRLVSLANASSGQQATLPILVGLNKVSEASVQHTYIEEPEAHIFPDAQNLLTRYIAEIHNQTRTNITLTTHSPYLLTTVNTLIYANTVASQSEEKAAKVMEIIPESEWLKAEDVAAYMVNEDGTVRSIMDEETGLIDADSIDDVSDVIGSEFNKILDIEFEEEAANA